ncbi:MAG: CapA family protein [Candidatus Margulisiibacteriota bacterium]
MFLRILIAILLLVNIAWAEPIKVYFVGDVMLGRYVDEKMQQKKEWRWPFLKIKDDLKAADILFGNLEGMLSDRGTEGKAKYYLRANPKGVKGLKYAGFTVLGLANNHVGDYGLLAFTDTINGLDENGIGWAGYDYLRNRFKPWSRVVKGNKITLFAYSEHMNLTAKVGKDDLRKEYLRAIKSAKESGAIVITSIHFGEEYLGKPTSEQKLLAHLSIDAGADLVVGHHPHVVQAIEKYKGKYIAYSLGNFVFDQNFSDATSEGLLLIANIYNSKLISIDPRRVTISKSFQVQLEPAK